MPRLGADREFHSGFIEGHLLLGIYWASLSHRLYTWDTVVWIGGFAAIETNVNEWRDELLEENNEKD